MVLRIILTSHAWFCTQRNQFKFVEMTNGVAFQKPVCWNFFICGIVTIQISSKYMVYCQVSSFSLYHHIFLSWLLSHFHHDNRLHLKHQQLVTLLGIFRYCQNMESAREAVGEVGENNPVLLACQKVKIVVNIILSSSLSSSLSSFPSNRQNKKSNALFDRLSS